MLRLLFRLVFLAAGALLIYAILTPLMPDGWAIQEVGRRFMNSLGAAWGQPVSP